MSGSPTQTKIGIGATLATAILLLLCVSSTGHATEPTPEAITTLGWWQSIWCMQRWSPYASGIGIGILSWLTFLLSNKAIGVSTAYARTSGMIDKWIEGPQVEEKEYYREYAPKVDWGWMLVAGLFVGAFLSAYLSGDFKIEVVPSLWETHFGDNPFLRLLATFVGGTILGIGARWADGCTSGHGISGTLQLIVSSWIAVMCFLVGGIVTAHLMVHLF